MWCPATGSVGAVAVSAPWQAAKAMVATSKCICRMGRSCWRLSVRGLHSLYRIPAEKDDILCRRESQGVEDGRRASLFDSLRLSPTAFDYLGSTFTLSGAFATSHPVADIHCAILVSLP